MQPTSESQNSVAQLLSMLRERGVQDKLPAVATIATGEGLPAISKQLVEKIQAWESVDFAQLPPAKGIIKGASSSLEGQILVIQAADLLDSSKLITDLAMRVQCCSVYMAVVTDNNPKRTRSMLAYLTLIAKSSLKYCWTSWLVYNQNFRQQVAEMSLKDWSKVDPSIYAQCFKGASVKPENWCKQCDLVDHVSDSCPLKACSGSERAPPGHGASLHRKRWLPHSNPEFCKCFNGYDGDCKFEVNCIYKDQKVQKQQSILRGTHCTSTDAIRPASNHGRQCEIVGGRWR